MQNRLYVGNLGPDVSASTLQELFEPHGFVTDVKLVRQGASREAWGFAFVIMATDEAADAAVAALNGAKLHGAVLRVEVAQEDPTLGAAGKA